MLGGASSLSSTAGRALALALVAAAVACGDSGDVARPGASAPWLPTTCSSCHRAGGPGGGKLDLRAVLPLAATKTCGATATAGTLGIAGAKVLAPGRRRARAGA